MVQLAPQHFPGFQTQKQLLQDIRSIMAEPMAGLTPTVWMWACPLLIPMMLELTEPDTMGVVFSLVGVGMLIGTLVMSIWGGPKRRIYGILLPGALMGVFYALLGMSSSLVVSGVSGFLWMLFLPIINGSNQALWQVKTAPDVQGRVFAARNMIGQLAGPIAIILAGPLVEGVFQPLMN